MFKTVATKAAKINPVTVVKTRRYEKQIKASQEKIGPYVPQPCPVQIWA